jgi:hypothetical protein
MRCASLSGTIAAVADCLHMKRQELLALLRAEQAKQAERVQQALAETQQQSGDQPSPHEVRPFVAFLDQAESDGRIAPEFAAEFRERVTEMFEVSSRMVRAVIGDPPDVPPRPADEEKLTRAAMGFKTMVAHAHRVLINSRDTVHHVGDMLQRELQAPRTHRPIVSTNN